MPKKYGVKEKDQVVAHILELLLTGRLRTGDRVDRNEITAALNDFESDDGIGAIVITGYTVNPGSDTQMLVLRLLPDALVPEITLADANTLPATALTDGQTTVLDYGAVPSGSAVTRSFQITNPGSADLTISSITAPTGFSVLGAPSVVTVGGIATFQIRLDATSAGFFSGSIVIASNDADEASFDFPVRGSVDAPEIAVSLDGTALSDAQASTVNYRSTLMGSQVIRSFTVANQGFSSLTISSITAPAGFTVQNAPSSIASSSSAVFQLRLDAASAGLFSGNLVITSNDSDEANFEIPVVGNVMAVLPPPGQLDAGFGSGGQVTQGITTGQDHYYSVAQQADGKIIAAGRTYTGGRVTYDVLVTRWNTDGTPDITFGSGGAVIYDLNGNSDTANSVLVQPDGKIVFGLSAIKSCGGAAAEGIAESVSGTSVESAPAPIGTAVACRKVRRSIDASPCVEGRAQPMPAVNTGKGISPRCDQSPRRARFPPALAHLHDLSRLPRELHPRSRTRQLPLDHRHAGDDLDLRRGDARPRSDARRS